MTSLLARSNPATSGPRAFVPTAVRALDLGAPLGGIAVGPSSTGIPYGGIGLLVRLHGDPLGFATLPLTGDRLAPNDLAASLWTAVGERAVAHARRHRCLPVSGLGPDALMQGLPPTGAECLSVPSLRSTAPSVSVIVPTAGRAGELARCLHSLCALSYGRFDILIVDNLPADPATRRLVQAVASADDRVRYLAEERPGSSVARNAGVAHTTAEFVAFTDDDATVEPDWLDWLIEPFMSDPDVDAVTGLVLPAELETQAQRWFEDYGGFGKGFERRVYDLDQNRANRLLYPYWGGVFGSGNSMAFRRPALAAIGGFDPALGAGSPARGGADIEAFSHVILRGGRLVYQPRSICWHVHRRDEAALGRQLFAYGVGLAAILTKWLPRDPRLLAGLARALRPVLRGALGPSRTSVRDRPNLPPALNRLELRGMLLGPALYLRSVLWSRRRRLADVLPTRAPVRVSTSRTRMAVRYVTNLASMTAREDGYAAAAGVAAQLVAAEIRKLPRLAHLALSARGRNAAKHPAGYSEAILEDLARLPVVLRPYEVTPEEFDAHVRSFPYPKAYAAGPLDEGGNRENKLLEYFVSLEMLDIRPGEVVIDVASERSIFPELVRQTCGATVFRQDLLFRPGLHGDRIGGSAASMPVPEQFADKLVLHNSFEHFEGTADSDFVAEAWRVLKPGGTVLIVPLFVSERHSILSDPLTDRRAIAWDEGADVLELPGWHNRFGRFYDASALDTRVLSPARALGYEVELVHFANVKTVHPQAAMHFALLMRKLREPPDALP